MDAITYATVFERGAHGYDTFRIPTLARAVDGTVLAFAEGRRHDPGDDGDIDVVLRRSTDGGASWGPLQVVCRNGADKASNPVPVLDRRTGRMVLYYTTTTAEATELDVRCGYAERRAHIMSSDDHGASWSDPREITEAVRPPDFRHFVGGPVHGIQLSRGAHAGRLVIPGNHSIAPPPGSGIDCSDPRLYGAHALHSDDGGRTWSIGAVDSSLDSGVNANESTVAEREDGTLYFNARDQHGSAPGNRAATTSSDGGATFDAPYAVVPDLVAPVVQGSVLRLSADPATGPARFVFSAPSRATARERLSLRTSEDEGRTWHGDLVVHDGPVGYSDLVETGETGEMGDAAGTPRLSVCFENGVRRGDGSGQEGEPYYQRITFATVPLTLVDAVG